MIVSGHARDVKCEARDYINAEQGFLTDRHLFPSTSSSVLSCMGTPFPKRASPSRMFASCLGNRVTCCPCFQGRTQTYWKLAACCKDNCLAKVMASLLTCSKRDNCTARTWRLDAPIRLHVCLLHAGSSFFDDPRYKKVTCFPSHRAGLSANITAAASTGC